MEWKPIEDKICCLVFFKNHVFHNIDINASVSECIKHGVNKQDIPIRMKLGTIAAICDLWSIPIQSPLSRIPSYTKQLFDAFKEIQHFSLIHVSQELDNILKKK